MNKMLIDRSTVEQALEALMCVDLQSLVPDYGSGHYSVARLDGPQVKSAITAMEAALAEPRGRKTKPPKGATTRLGIVCFEAYARSYTGTKRWDIAAEAVRATLAETQEPDSPERRCGGPGCDMKCCQPVQEPAGQLQEEAFGRGQVMWFNKPADLSMLYTAPPQRKED